MHKIIICLCALAIASSLQAKPFAHPESNRTAPAEPVATLNSKPAVVDATAPEDPKGTWKDSDKFETRKDAHGHDYDVRTGNVICLEKPYLFKDSLYGSPSLRNIPLGHTQCISPDREFTTR